MKALPEILRDAIILLNEKRAYRERYGLKDVDQRVVIGRGDSGPLNGRTYDAFQIRLCLEGPVEYKCESRVWEGAQWSKWREYGGAAFNIRDVLATDWRIVS
jgi:hypothetical protein